jgi:hypothetical protein
MTGTRRALSCRRLVRRAHEGRVRCLEEHLRRYTLLTPRMKDISRQKPRRPSHLRIHEPGRFSKSPEPGTQGHSLLLNAHIPVDLEHGEPRPFGASDGSRYSSTGQGLPYDAEGTRADSRLSSNAE